MNRALRGGEWSVKLRSRLPERIREGNGLSVTGMPRHMDGESLAGVAAGDP